MDPKEASYTKFEIHVSYISSSLLHVRYYTSKIHYSLSSQHMNGFLPLKMIVLKSQLLAIKFEPSNLKPENSKSA